MKDKIFQSITFLDCGETLSDNEIKIFETEHNIRLPNDYRKFLMTINGGCPYPKNVICSQLNTEEYNNVSKDIEQFEVLEILGLTHIGCESQTCIKNLSATVKYVNVPNSMSFIPIGIVTGSNYIYLSISDDYYGKIFLGNYSFGISKDDTISEFPIDFNEIYEEDCIASSFNSFLNKLFDKNAIVFV
jgi:hypothetical protein